MLLPELTTLFFILSSNSLLSFSITSVYWFEKTTFSQITHKERGEISPGINHLKNQQFFVLQILLLLHLLSIGNHLHSVSPNPSKIDFKSN